MLAKIAAKEIFQPTPSARRVTRIRIGKKSVPEISTHTLRKEGDGAPELARQGQNVFQPTPSARRVTSTLTVSIVTS